MLAFQRPISVLNHSTHSVTKRERVRQVPINSINDGAFPRTVTGFFKGFEKFHNYIAKLISCRRCFRLWTCGDSTLMSHALHVHAWTRDVFILRPSARGQAPIASVFSRLLLTPVHGISSFHTLRSYFWINASPQLRWPSTYKKQEMVKKWQKIHWMKLWNPEKHREWPLPFQENVMYVIRRSLTDLHSSCWFWERERLRVSSLFHLV